MSKLAKREEKIESDDSEDEHIESRIGEVPHSWYRKEQHFGYDHDGKQVEKAEGLSGIFNKKPNFWTRFWKEQKTQESF